MPGISPMVLKQLVQRASTGDPQAIQILQQLGYDPMGNPILPGGPQGMPPGGPQGMPPGGGMGPGGPPGMPPGQAPTPQQVPQMVGALRGGA